jgi:cytidyltransferase-like protein
MEELLKVKKMLEASGNKWWMDFGQLLSFHRSGNPLPWKDDWDFCVENPLSIMKMKHTLRRIFPNVLMKPHFLKAWNSSMEVDLYFCMKGPLYTRLMHFPSGMKVQNFFLDELEEIEVEGEAFPVPRHLDHYLELRYGHDWRVPTQVNMSGVVENLSRRKYSCLVPGVFDCLHEGHKQLISRALSSFDDVVVGVHSSNIIDYKAPPLRSMEERVSDLLNWKPVRILKDCPLETGREFLSSQGFDFVMFGREEGERMQRFYPDSRVNHPVSRYPGISSTMIREASASASLSRT